MNTSLWWTLGGLGAVLMRIGLAVYTTGAVRSKNSAAALMRSTVDLAIAALAFWAVGQWIAPPHQSPALFFLLLCLMLIPSGIVVGVVAERSRFFPMCIFPLLLAGLIVPLSARLMVGWLATWGYRDLAGASTFHLTGALAALTAAILVGPRQGKFNRDGSSNAIPGHNLPLASVGVLLILLSFLLYVPAFSAADPDTVPRLATNVLLAAAAGALTALAVSHFKYLKPDIHLTYVGLLASLVAISAAADVPSTGFAVLIGAVAGLLVPLATVWLDLACRIDDPTAGIGIHGLGALWGVLAAGLFTSTDSFASRLKLLGVQLLGLLVIAALTIALSATVLLILKATTGLRAKDADEFDGLDLAEHDIGAYPDFQQTTIKSYHLREA